MLKFSFHRHSLYKYRTSAFFFYQRTIDIPYSHIIDNNVLRYAIIHTLYLQARTIRQRLPACIHDFQILHRYIVRITDTGCIQGSIISHNARFPFTITISIYINTIFGIPCPVISSSPLKTSPRFNKTLLPGSNFTPRSFSRLFHASSGANPLLLSSPPVASR